jgi:rRNA maturation RNase YbeY
MKDSFSISRTVRAKEPTLPYARMKNDILGSQYVVSLVFVGAKRAQSLNRAHRGKTYVPNVLSFPIDSQTGEIYITPKVAEREAKNYNLSPRGYIGYLFIHALLHLKGLDHGATMEKAEARYIKAYRLS